MRIRNKIGIKKGADYNERLNNTKILANARFSGEIEQKYELKNGKMIEVYVPKNYSKEK